MGTLFNRRRVMGGSNLHYDAAVEYIRSDGNAYMIIPVSGTSETTTFYLEFIVYNTSNDSTILGSRSSGDTRFCWVVAPDVDYIQIGYASSWNNISIRILNGDVVSVQTIISGNNIDYLVTNKTRGTSVHFTYKLSSFTTYPFVYLFWSGVLNKSKNMVKELWIADNGVKTSDCIPVRIDNTGYLYDKVNKTFYGNEGTGSFILGPDKT